MIVSVSSLFLSMLVTTALGSCLDGFICKQINDTYELFCKPEVNMLKLQTVGGLLADVPTQATRVKVKCFNLRVPVKLTFANLSHIRELTFERLNVSASESNFFHGIANITRLVLRDLSWKRLEKGYFEGLANLRSLTIEHLDNLEFLHPDVLAPLVSLQSLSFRYVRSTNEMLRYVNYSHMLGSIKSSQLHTLVLYAIHTQHDTEIRLDIDDLFHYGTVGETLKYLDLGNNYVADFRGHPITTLPSLEYLSLAENVILGSKFLNPFWIQLIGHVSLKTLDVSGINSQAAVTSTDILFSLTVDNDCSGAIKLRVGPRLESISLSDTILLAQKFSVSFTAPFCFNDIHNVVKYIDISDARCSLPVSCSIDQLHALEYFNMQNVNAANIPVDLFSKMPNLTVLLMGKNSIGDVVANDKENHLFYNKSKLRVLDLAGCQLTKIPPNEFSNLRQLQHLNLSGNSLRHFHMNLQHVTNIRIMNLSRNKLTTLGAAVRTQLDKMAAKRRVDLDISGNPLRCTCTETDFVTWTHVSKVSFLNKDNTFCIDGNKTKQLLFQIDSKALETTCHPDYWWYLRIVLPVVFVTLVVVIVVFAACRYRWKCAYLWSRATLRRTPSDIKLEQVVYERDVFICYNSTDSGWVCHDLLDKLDKYKITTVIHHRDFLPGSILEETINESIAKCRYTMLVLSPDFLVSNWCLLEMHLARNRIISEGRDVIVPVILREFPMSLLTRTLEGILSKSYLQWTSDPDGQALFWDKLTTKLKHGGNLRPLKM